MSSNCAIISDSSESSDSSYKTPEKKRKHNKRVCRFQESWLKDDKFEKWISECKNEKSFAKCNFCETKISVKYDGVRALIAHMKTDKHMKRACQNNTSQSIENFFQKKNEINYDIIAAELMWTYHGVKHHHSYLSQDCSNKIQKKIYKDSSIAKQIQCGRTKAEALVEMVLAPYSLEIILKELGDSPFSISTDASNKGNRKMFPVAI